MSAGINQTSPSGISFFLAVKILVVSNDFCIDQRRYLEHLIDNLVQKTCTQN